VISENRDILVERLEQKLVAKEREVNELRSSIKESIVEELREGMKEDLNFDKRISVLENKLKDISQSYNGVMKELLDQKTIIRDIKEKYLNDDKVNPGHYLTGMTVYRFTRKNHILKKRKLNPHQVLSSQKVKRKRFHIRKRMKRIS